MKICVIGSGYVGLVTGTCFAESGNDVTCVDIDEKKIAALKAGHIPIYEPDLENLISQNVGENRLHFTTDLTGGLAGCEVCFIAVGTPPNEDGSADLKHVLAAAKEVAQKATGPLLLGTKSTVPVGTGDKVEKIVSEHAQVAIDVFSNPEFLKEGDAVRDFMKPDRVVIGTDNSKTREVLRELYAPFTLREERLIFTSRRAAEIIKYAANAMLATRISFMNEIANLCDAVGANVQDVRRGVGSDPRIGSAFLFPGIGYGGSCFPKDVKALIRTAREYHVPMDVTSATEAANQRQKTILLDKMKRHFDSDGLKDRKIAIWGLTFKPRTDDVREAPALEIIDGLLKAGARVAAFDPKGMEHVRALLGDHITYCDHAYSCLEGADALVICTEWNEFRSPDFDRMKKLMKQPIIFDGRNILAASHPQTRGFHYVGIGMGEA